MTFVLHPRIGQCDVVDLMVKKGLNQNDIYNKGWLNLERVYKRAGWNVEYDEPDNWESYEPTFKFEAPKTR